MPTFVPISSASQVPAVGEGAEQALWDLKERLSTNAFELAKDVAAFANHLGGTLLVGAIDDGTGQIRDFRQLTSKEADTSEKSIAQAVANRCRPLPLINYERIRHGEGLLLAVNVWPSISTVVGVRVQANKADGFGGDAFVVPVRLGASCSYLSPENFPMHMLPALRRIVILLSSIPPGEQVLYCPKGGNNRVVTLSEIDELGNSVMLLAGDEKRGAKRELLVVALDRIISVYRGDRDAPPRWCIVMHND